MLMNSYAQTLIRFDVTRWPYTLSGKGSSPPPPPPVGHKMSFSKLFASMVIYAIK